LVCLPGSDFGVILYGKYINLYMLWSKLKVISIAMMGFSSGLFFVPISAQAGGSYNQPIGDKVVFFEYNGASANVSKVEFDQTFYSQATTTGPSVWARIANCSGEPRDIQLVLFGPFSLENSSLRTLIAGVVNVSVPDYSTTSECSGEPISLKLLGTFSGATIRNNTWYRLAFSPFTLPQMFSRGTIAGSVANTILQGSAYEYGKDHLGNSTVSLTDFADISFVITEGRLFPFEPVVIVPGIMGSRLNRVSDGEEVWPNVGNMLVPGSDDYLGDLILDSNGEQVDGAEMYAGSIVDEELAFVFYRNLIDGFVQDGYVENSDLFIAPYDWRMDIGDEISRLDAKIQQAISNSPDGKISIVTHSMGGLLVKEYLKQFSDTSFVDKLVLAGVPRLGSPKAFKILGYGDDLGMNFLGLGLNQDKTKDIAQNMPGVYELLPSRRYVQTNGGYVKDFRDGVNILDYDQTKQFMTSDPSDSRNSSLIDLADNFHQGLDTQNVNATDVYNIVGCQNPSTIGEFRVYNDGKFDISSTNGDGTVPLTSATNLADGFENYFVRYDVTGIDHAGLIKDDRTVNLISRIVEGEPTMVLPTGISNSSSYCFDVIPDPTENGTTISFSTHSPVALHIYDIYDSQDRHTGPLPNGDIELGIPGSVYEMIGENSFVFVPAGNNYRVVADGLSAGSFDLKTKIFNGSTLVKEITYLSVPLESDQTNAELNFSGIQGNLDLNLDNDGDGNFDTIVQPSAILSQEESTDVMPPVIVMPDIPDEILLNSSLTFNFETYDDISGVDFAEATLDRLPVLDGETRIMSQIGEHAFRIKAVDRAGNPFVKELKFNVIYGFGGFLPPVKLDGTGMYKKGRTLPVKFQLKDSGGNFVSIAVASISISKISDGVLGGTVIALSNSAASFGDLFRYDTASNSYIFNLSTDNMSPGTWQLSVDLDDGKSYNVNVAIK
jgi:hypothetical protein